MDSKRRMLRWDGLSAHQIFRPHGGCLPRTAAKTNWGNGLGRFDRYILTQLMVLFSFFSLVLISIYWIEAAVGLFDSLIAEGESIGVFLEFTALALPRIMLLVLPVAGFVATLYIFNRMINESEMVVMQTAGLSALRLMRPVVLFGLILAVLVAILGNILAPAAQGRYVDRMAEVRADLTGRFLRAGEFIHPADGLTVYIREITELGEFYDMFLQDAASAEGVQVTYTATRALLVRSDQGPRLVMFDGVAQTLDLATGRLATVQFADFTYNVSSLLDAREGRDFSLGELPTGILVRATAQDAEFYDIPLARMRYEGHDRIARALFVIFPPIIAGAALLLGTFSRFGVWRQILVAVVLVIPLQAIWNVSEATARQDADAYLLAYTQPIAAALVASVLIALASINRRSSWDLRRLLRGGADPSKGAAV